MHFNAEETEAEIPGGLASCTDETQSLTHPSALHFSVASLDRIWGHPACSRAHSAAGCGLEFLSLLPLPRSHGMAGLQHHACLQLEDTAQGFVGAE